MIAQPSKLTNEQVKRVVLAVDELARRGNPIAKGWSENLKDKPIDEQRRIIGGTWAMIYEVMVSVQMALDARRRADKVTEILEQLGAGG